jgi:endonuclease YncB( thermonuclease family)
MLYHKIMKFLAPHFYLCILLLICTPARAQTPASCAYSPQEIVQITKINSDNSIQLDDGRVIKLAGIDETSRSILSKTYLLLNQLTPSAQIKISTGGVKDRWGRIGAHVFITPNEAQEQAWLQGFLLQFGHSRLSLEAHTDPCIQAMKALETEAINQKQGLWAENFAIIESSNAAELLKRRGELVHIRGSIVGIGETRTVYYLNFGTSWQKDLSIVILKRHMKLFDEQSLSPRSLDRKQVYIRGIVDGDVGPRLEVSRPDQIEKLD